MFSLARRQLVSSTRWAVPLTGIWLAGLTANAGAPDSLAEAVPSGAVGFVEVSGLGDVAERLSASLYWDTILASPQIQELRKSPEYRKAEAVRTIVERQLGRDAYSAVADLLGHKVGLAVYVRPGREQPDALLIVRTAETNTLAELRKQLDPFLVLAEEQVRITATLEGVERLTVGEKVFAAWKDDWLAVASTSELLDEGVRRLGGERGESLADDEAYQAMLARLPKLAPDGGRLVLAMIDTGRVNELAGGRMVPAKLDNPLGSLLVGDTFELLSRSSYGAVTVDVKADGLLTAVTIADGAGEIGEPHRGFFPQEGEDGVHPLPAVPDLVGGFTLFRDYADWYGHREELLQEQVLPGFDKFESGLANLLPGRDFGQDVLPLVGKRLTFVAAPQDYSHLDGAPGLKLPGFGLVVELAEPEEGAALLQLFFQTLTAILNIQAGQQGRQPWVVTSEAYHDVQISYAKYLKKPSGERLGVVFNFLPAAARVDDRFIIASSLGLCRQLIDHYRAPQGQADEDGAGSGGDPPRTLSAEVRFGPLAELVATNREFFVGEMVKGGRAVEEAQAQLDAVTALVRQFEGLRLSTVVLPDAFQIQLEGSWK